MWNNRNFPRAMRVLIKLKLEECLQSREWVTDWLTDTVLERRTINASACNQCACSHKYNNTSYAQTPKTREAIDHCINSAVDPMVAIRHIFFCLEQMNRVWWSLDAPYARRCVTLNDMALAWKLIKLECRKFLLIESTLRHRRPAPPVNSSSKRSTNCIQVD